MRNTVFWIGFGLMAIPALLGIVAGAAIISVVGLVGVLVCLAACAGLLFCCLPLMLWCAIFDRDDWTLFKKFVKQGTDDVALN